MPSFVFASEVEWDAIVDDSLYFETDLGTGGVLLAACWAEWTGGGDGWLAGSTTGRLLLGEDGLRRRWCLILISHDFMYAWLDYLIIVVGFLRFWMNLCSEWLYARRSWRDDCTFTFENKKMVWTLLWLFDMINGVFGILWDGVFGILWE